MTDDQLATAGYQTPHEEILDRLAGQEIPGGCEDCLAIQTVTADPDHPGIWHLWTRHVETCPTYAAISSRIGEGP